MGIYRIEGGTPLRGEYRVRGAKNSALPVLAATFCRSGTYEIYGCPRIGDVAAMEKILQALGARTHWQGNCLIVESRGASESEVPRELMEKLRSSVFLLGSLLARFGEATIYKPGGCKIGSRPIDIHIEGLKQLGFSVEEEGERVTCRGRCKGGHVRLAYPSVGATENLMLAALSAPPGCETILENCALEPEIADLQGFLCCCGYQVNGAETGTGTIRIGGGTEKRHDVMYFLLEDRIEAATYMMAAAGTGGRIVLDGVRASLLQPVIKVLSAMGSQIRCFDEQIEVRGPGRGGLLSPGIVTTAPYPGFPTDCQPQLLSLATMSRGLTTIREEIFDSRFTHKKDLMNMGANIETCGKNAIIKGVDALHGTSVCAQDLRGGAALVIAALMADGVTELGGVQHIERGYEDLPATVRRLGGTLEEKQTGEKTEANEPTA